MPAANLQVTSFDDIFAQDSALEWLRAAITADRLPHGLIFAGPAGVGKATTARALATIFLCESHKTAAACGKCESCRGMSAGVHPDYHIIVRQLIRFIKSENKARDVSVDVIREYLLAPAGNKAVMGRGKVFVIEEAELMNPQAQNALLKTLEEPLGRTLIVLITNQPNLLLPTIRSRCQFLKFSSLPDDLVQRELEKRGINKRDAADAARITEGSLGLSIRWLEDGVIDASRELARRLDERASDSSELAAFLKHAADGYAEKQLKRDDKASEDQARREGLVILLTNAANHLRRRLSTEADGDVLEGLCRGIDAALATELYIDSNVTVALALEQFAVAVKS